MLRSGSGGEGRYNGGDGVIRELRYGPKRAIFLDLLGRVERGEVVIIVVLSASLFVLPSWWF
jgi:hypothetical protein